MPDVRNCKRCGKIYNYMGGVMLCPVCREEDEEDFKRIKDYLYDNPRATMMEVSKDLDISVEKIKRFLREGRLEIVGNENNLILECEMCGKAIKSGRFCEACEKELASGLSKTAKEISKNFKQDESRNVGMRYINKFHKSE